MNDRARVYIQRHYPFRGGWRSSYYALTFIDVCRCMHKEHRLARPPLAISLALVSALLSVCFARKANGELGFESPKLYANAFGWTEISVGNESRINARGYTEKIVVYRWKGWKSVIWMRVKSLWENYSYYSRLIIVFSPRIIRVLNMAKIKCRYYIISKKYIWIEESRYYNLRDDYTY